MLWCTVNVSWAPPQNCFFPQIIIWGDHRSPCAICNAPVLSPVKSLEVQRLLLGLKAISFVYPVEAKTTHLTVVALLPDTAAPPSLSFHFFLKV